MNDVGQMHCETRRKAKDKTPFDPDPRVVKDIVKVLKDHNVLKGGLRTVVAKALIN